MERTQHAPVNQSLNVLVQPLPEEGGLCARPICPYAD